jgi:hypothetical protein
VIVVVEGTAGSGLPQETTRDSATPKKILFTTTLIPLHCALSYRLASAVFHPRVLAAEVTFHSELHSAYGNSGLAGPAFPRPRQRRSLRAQYRQRRASRVLLGQAGGTAAAAFQVVAGREPDRR